MSEHNESRTGTTAADTGQTASAKSAANSRILAGNIPRAILGLAGPMLVSAVLQNAQSLIDLYWVGRLGPVAVAALALSGVVMMALFPIQMGLATGTVALVARSYGAGEKERASSLAAQSLTLGVILGTIIGFAAIPFLAAMCRLLGAEPDVVDAAVRYLRPSMIGMPIGMILFLSNSAMQASGNTIIPMVAMLAANLLNMVLDPLFIFGWGWIPGTGVAGAAWATVLSHVISAVGLMVILMRGRTNLHLRWPEFRPTWRDSLSFMRIGLPSAGQMSSRSLTNLVFFSIVVRFGTFVVAGYGIGARWHMVLLLPCFVLGNATATMVGQNLGAGQPQRARRSAWCSAGMISLVLALSSGLLYIFTEASISFFDATPAVVEVGARYLRTVLPFYLFVGLSIIIERALSGAGSTMVTMTSTIIALWGVQVPLAMLFSGSVAIPGCAALSEFFARIFVPQTQGVWWAMNMATVVNMIILLVWFATGRWMHKKL